MKTKVSPESLISFAAKKSFHVSADNADIVEFKIICMRRKMSMQQMLSQFVKKLASGDQDCLKIADEIADDVHIKKIKSHYNKHSSNDLYKAILLAKENFIEDDVDKDDDDDIDDSEIDSNDEEDEDDT